MLDLQPGDRATFRAGAPMVTVCDRFPGDRPDEVRCRWFTPSGEPVYAKLDAKLLMPVGGELPLFDRRD